MSIKELFAFQRLERSSGVKNGSPVASLDIKLKDANIDGITKFKLFLPWTRNGINEVVTANLFIPRITRSEVLSRSSRC